MKVINDIPFSVVVGNPAVLARLDLTAVLDSRPSVLLSLLDRCARCHSPLGKSYLANISLSAMIVTSVLRKAALFCFHYIVS